MSILADRLTGEVSDVAVGYPAPLAAPAAAPVTASSADNAVKPVIPTRARRVRRERFTVHPPRHVRSACRGRATAISDATGRIINVREKIT
jgi:hypothetical protein